MKNGLYTPALAVAQFLPGVGERVLLAVKKGKRNHQQNDKEKRHINP